MKGVSCEIYFVLLSVYKPNVNGEKRYALSLFPYIYLTKINK